MIPETSYLLARAGSVYVTTMLTAALWLWRKPPRRVLTTAMLACFWNVPAILLLQVAAARFG